MVDPTPHAPERDPALGRAAPSRRGSTWARYAAAVALALAAINHAALALAGAPSVARHAAFVGINLVAALLVAMSPRAALWPLALLTVQQLASHGADLVRAARAGSLDAASLGVVIFFPALTALLIFERRRGTPARPPPARRAP